MNLLKTRSTRDLSVTVVIPTKDRPNLLDEAIASALAQTHDPDEVIVVDDGSAIPVDAAAQSKRHGRSVRVVRNETSCGLAFSRNRGVEESSAEYVVHLDDDDLLAPDAIERCLEVMRHYPDVEWVMFAVVGFGPRAKHFDEVQSAGVERVIELADGARLDASTVVFGRRLFPALLQTVPIAFQRAMLRRDTWSRVCELRWNAYREAEGLPDLETAKLALTGPLRDSEWARYAAIACHRVALVTHPLYLQRCAGQGYSSRPENRQLHAVQSLKMLEVLWRAANSVPALMEWASDIRVAMARNYFNFAYSRSVAGDHRAAWRYWGRAVATRPDMRQLRLAARMLARSFRVS